MTSKLQINNLDKLCKSATHVGYSQSDMRGQINALNVALSDFTETGHVLQAANKTKKLGGLHCKLLL